MIEKPVMFSAPMVLAVLEGRKTQTRRLAKARSRTSLLRGQPGDPQEKRWGGFEPWTDGYILDPGNYDWLMSDAAHRPGEGCWIREAFRLDVAYDDNKPSEMSPRAAVWFEAGGAGALSSGGRRGKLRPSIHQPRWASRIDLLCTGARVERLQDISPDDAIAEGIVQETVPCNDGVERTLWFGVRHAGTDDPVIAYQDLWDSLHNPRGLCADDNSVSWAANPLVWVYDFTVARAPA